MLSDSASDSSVTRLPADEQVRDLEEQAQPIALGA